jgi:hypothetical protein
VVLFHEQSLWERYRSYIIGAAGLVVLQSLLIGLLLVQRAQRRRAQRSLADRLRFETLLSNLSTTLSSCPTQEIDREIETGLRRIVEDLGTDRAILWSLDDRAGEARVTHAWARPGIPPIVAVIKKEQFPWLRARIREGQVLHLPSPVDPDEAPVDRHSLAQMGTRFDCPVAPLSRAGGRGGLSVGTVLEERRWADELALLASSPRRRVRECPRPAARGAGRARERPGHP